MARALRFDPPDGWHHVMNRGVDRMTIFRDDHDRIVFGQLLAIACERHGVVVHAYCLMTNHFHLLVHCPNGHVSDFLHDLCGTYARRFNWRHGRTGHLFGDRFTSRLVETDQYVWNAVRYIHRNPLDIAGVADCSAYRWSSHRAYLGLRQAPPWLATRHVLKWFANAADFHRQVSTPLGDSVRSCGQSIAPGDVESAVDLVIHERTDRVGRSIRAQRSAVIVAVSDAVGDPAILDTLTTSTDSSLRSAKHRGRRHFDEHPDDVHFVSRVLDLVA